MALFQRVDVFLAMLVGLPVVAALLGKLGRAGVILYGFWNQVKDGKADDQEVATTFWRLAAVIGGLWPNSQAKILVFAPDHQRELLRKQGFTAITRGDK